MLYRWLLRPWLFLLSAEAAHGIATAFLGRVHGSPALARLVRLFHRPAPELAVQALGRTLASPLGVAAGFDKSGELYNGLAALGFGAVDVGTVTALAQPGNPRPRLFRLARDRAVVNRMGFNNPGAAAVAEALASHPPRELVRGVNLGKSKVTDLAHAATDYAESARVLGPWADYVVVNVSSPNTPGLRSLQSVEALRPILLAVQGALAGLASPPPLLVKIAPDLADEDLDAVADLAIELGLAGIVATNTTVAREGLGLTTPADEIARIGAGGLSGAPLRARSLAVVRRLHARAAGRLTLVGVGGIASADDVWSMLQAGATLVQMYTTIVYEGPGIACAIHRGLRARMRREGVRSLAELVGTKP
jgi:dihydroorotate dehydrogenase